MVQSVGRPAHVAEKCALSKDSSRQMPLRRSMEQLRGPGRRTSSHGRRPLGVTVDGAVAWYYAEQPDRRP